MPTAPLQITVNGQLRELEPGATIATLLAAAGHDPRLVAVERNGVIVKRARYADTALEPDDRLEIVRFVQGG